MNIENIQIIKANISDLPELQKVAEQTFIETFAPHNTDEDMKNYITRSFSEEQLKKELTEKLSEFYLAVLDGKIAGYLKINFGRAQTDIYDEDAMEIERIYALKEYHGKGVGQRLFNAALQSAGGAGVNYIWLGVWEKNHKALNFYIKNGFVRFGEHIFKVGTDEQTDYLMNYQISGKETKEE